MNIYLAARFSLASRMRWRRADLRQYGYEVTSRWIDYDTRPDLPSNCEMISSKDLEDIEKADLVIVDALQSSTRGGLHTELGYALGLGKEVWVICYGTSDDNVFFWAPHVTRFTSWAGVMQKIEEMKNAKG